MRRTVYLEKDGVEYFYCGWYQFEGDRYPKYTTNKEVALIFLNKAYAINMIKVKDGFILLEDRLELVDESEIKID